MGLFDKARKKVWEENESRPDIKDVVKNYIQFAKSKSSAELRDLKRTLALSSDDETRVSMVCYGLYDSAVASGVNPVLAIAIDGVVETIQGHFKLSHEKITQIFILTNKDRIQELTK